MEVLAPFPGLIVVKTTYKAGREGQVEIIEGDEVRPGLPVIDIVDTSTMHVRERGACGKGKAPSCGSTDFRSCVSRDAWIS